MIRALPSVTFCQKKKENPLLKVQLQVLVAPSDTHSRFHHHQVVYEGDPVRHHGSYFVAITDEAISARQLVLWPLGSDPHVGSTQHRVRHRRQGGVRPNGLTVVHRTTGWLTGAGTDLV